MNARPAIFLSAFAGLAALWALARQKTGAGAGQPAGGIALSDIGAKINVADETAAALRDIAKQVLSEGGSVEYSGAEGELSVTSQALRRKFAGPLQFIGTALGRNLFQGGATWPGSILGDPAWGVIPFYVYLDAFNNVLAMQQPLHPEGVTVGDKFILE